ncbi:glycosyltransferase [Christiangramia sp.]|uniref:glycosyltransferase n=1 Tax=Christiangramia sp. TaxID=1931228 RepID=UPI002619A23B|nr:glycosyltransferase [Christiangramia sp.]
MGKNNFQLSKSVSDSKRNKTLASAENEYDLMVFSHLRWNFVYQRPQHLISRISRHYKILFIEEPIADEIEDGYELNIIHKNLHVFKPRVKDMEAIPSVLLAFLQSTQVEYAWFYSPSFSSLLAYIDVNFIIYDCMDELSLFKGAPAELIEQEKFLISEADIVFTGGKSLYESKSQRHPNTFCFPSSVEREHFEKARYHLSLPEDLKHIPSLIVGYCGVIDERIDMDLLQNTALLLPGVSFVMIGPLAKIDDSELARAPNIFYLGMKSYESLPQYLAAFNIAMMPFALNDSTKYISPTKTLEYMAAGKPIISTAIKDVERDYSHCIPIISTAEEFAAAIKELLNTNNQEYQQDYNKILDRTSWDNTANSMIQILKETVK